jgi:hypothetical protein
VEVNLEELLDHCVVAIGAAVAIAFVDEKFMIVEGENLAHAGAGGEQVPVLMRSLSAGDVKGDDAQQLALRLASGGVLA